MDRPLPRDRAARGDGGTVAINRGLRRVGNLRMTIKPDVIVGSEVYISFVADQCFCASDPLMYAKERIGNAEKVRGLADHAQLPEPFEVGHIEPRGKKTPLFRPELWRTL